MGAYACAVDLGKGVGKAMARMGLDPRTHGRATPVDGAFCTHVAEMMDRARYYLESLGHDHHPEASTDPVYALFQVAGDAICTANGYEGLYKRTRQEQDTSGA